jgi:hypothetical protein
MGEIRFGFYRAGSARSARRSSADLKETGVALIANNARRAAPHETSESGYQVL